MMPRTEDAIIKYGGCKGPLHDNYFRMKDGTVVGVVDRGLVGASLNGD
jgi:hypothetical protein